MAGSAIWRWALSGLAFLIAVAHAPVAERRRRRKPARLADHGHPQACPTPSERGAGRSEPAEAAGQASTIATAAALDGDEQRTSFRLEL